MDSARASIEAYSGGIVWYKMAQVDEGQMVWKY